MAKYVSKCQMCNHTWGTKIEPGALHPVDCPNCEYNSNRITDSKLASYAADEINSLYEKIVESQKFLGVNPITVSTPEQGIKSGLSLKAARKVDLATSLLDEGYINPDEMQAILNSGEEMVKTLKDFANNPRTVSIPLRSGAVLEFEQKVKIANDLANKRLLDAQDIANIVYRTNPLMDMIREQTTVEVTLTSEEQLILKNFAEKQQGDPVIWSEIFEAQRIIRDKLFFFNAWDDDNAVTTRIDLPKKNNDLKYCDHTWKQYTGLNETFTYCSKCDIKKEGDNK